MTQKKKLTPAETKAKKDFLKFIEDKINGYAQRVAEKPDRADRSAMGELNFYVALRNVVKGNPDPRDMPSLRDLGLIDAVNDTLIHLDIIPRKKKFYNPPFYTKTKHKK